MGSGSGTEIYDKLWDRIYVLNEVVWERRLTEARLRDWLENFNGRTAPPDEEKLYALYVISHFMYFGSAEVRVLLKAMYRDLFLIPAIQRVGSRLDKPIDWGEASTLLADEIASTRFLGIGNPSESGVHLLYYFRQENGLPTEMFVDASRVLIRNSAGGGRDRPSEPGVRRYIFIDDICGTGDTAVSYFNEYVRDVRRAIPGVEFEYHCLFGTEKGLRNARENAEFSHVLAIYELDKSYEYTANESRYLSSCPEAIDEMKVRRLIYEYGAEIFPHAPLGYGGGDLLLGFHHNTPDNTLPIVWAEREHSSGVSWAPAFRRYPKFLGGVE